MNKYLKYAGILGIAALIGFAFGKYTTEPEIKTVIKEVVVEKKDIKTTKKKTVLPDGTKIIETTKEDKTVINSDKSSTTQVKSAKPQWKAQALAGIHDGKTVYGAGIERRILGPINAGLFGITNKTYGISLSIEF